MHEPAQLRSFSSVPWRLFPISRHVLGLTAGERASSLFMRLRSFLRIYSGLSGQVYKASHVAVWACNGCFYFVVSFSCGAVNWVCFSWIIRPTADSTERGVRSDSLPVEKTTFLMKGGPLGRKTKTLIVPNVTSSDGLSLCVWCTDRGALCSPPAGYFMQYASLLTSITWALLRSRVQFPLGFSCFHLSLNICRH